jgi:purine-nucleoside phosphorylase
MQGRFHFYEGYEPSLLVAPIRALRLAGIETFVMTNAAGGIDPSYRPGDLMVISDHLNFSGRNPLVGPHDHRYGPRFPDMSIAYDSELRRLTHEVARDLKQELREGVYAVLGGPSYETPAEVRALRVLGGAAVGMSTVYEVIAARQMGARVLGISLITNHAAGVAQELLDHAEVVAVGREASGRIVALLEGVLGRLGSAQSLGHEQSQNHEQ